jgi:hypothetical protein
MFPSVMGEDREEVETENCYFIMNQEIESPVSSFFVYYDVSGSLQLRGPFFFLPDISAAEDILASLWKHALLR